MPVALVPAFVAIVAPIGGAELTGVATVRIGDDARRGCVALATRGRATIARADRRGAAAGWSTLIEGSVVAPSGRFAAAVPGGGRAVWARLEKGMTDSSRPQAHRCPPPRMGVGHGSLVREGEWRVRELRTRGAIVRSVVVFGGRLRAETLDAKRHCDRPGFGEGQRTAHVGRLP